jgi:hypothetical protein
VGGQTSTTRSAMERFLIPELDEDEAAVFEH